MTAIETTGVGFYVGPATTNETPEKPDSVRGDVSEAHVKATREQLDDGLVWWRCSFCGRMVLVAAYRCTRERCECGAVRCHHQGQVGWRRDGEERWAI